MEALAYIKQVKNGEFSCLKEEKWLKFLTFTEELHANLERFTSLEDLPRNYVLNYVERTLNALFDKKPEDKIFHLVQETLKWSEVAKSGMEHQRKGWMKKGFNLFAHNIGSSQIYISETSETNEELRKIISTLIETHGLIGQYIRGEVPFSFLRPLYGLIEEGLLSPDELQYVLKTLDYCIITGVDPLIYEKIQEEEEGFIHQIVSGQFDSGYTLQERIRKLRSVSIKNGEDFELEFHKVFSNPEDIDHMEGFLRQADLWYPEAALFDFSFEEFMKILMLVAQNEHAKGARHCSFEKLMQSIYYQHEGKKRINIYKKRIIEKYLEGLSIEDILKGLHKVNPHVSHRVWMEEHLDDTLFFDFQFSPAGNKLIEFCIEAEKSDVLYESAIILLFDLFGLRKDQYDRFYEEERYLATMNQSIDYKRVILDYITGKSIVDIGPGGGALMDLIEEKYPDKKVLGVDIAENVLDNLRKKKNLESKKWDVLYGDALDLGATIEKGSVDTIIFCSILHELFSYIEYNGCKFNHETLAVAFRSVLEILPKGGRIIIRDGIMSEPEDQKRIIRFLSDEGQKFLERYVHDFKGRDIHYEIMGLNEVLMPINDAMEFLYTYTWGEKSYVHEVNEQFGYFTPTGYIQFIQEVLGTEVKIIECRHFLQDGYTVALSQKIEFFDEARNKVPLPDSTCIIVIEKQ